MRHFILVEAIDDTTILELDAPTEAEAEQIGNEYVAETGRDRELDYEGFEIFEVFSEDEQNRQAAEDWLND